MNALPDGLKNSAQVQLILNNILYLVEYYDVANDSTLTALLNSVEKKYLNYPTLSYAPMRRLKPPWLKIPVWGNSQSAIRAR